MTTTCKTCGEPISEEGAKLLRTGFKFPDPLAHVYLRLGKTGYFSNENGQTVAKPEPTGVRRRAKFRQP
jgi:hypothetical protein